MINERVIRLFVEATWESNGKEERICSCTRILFERTENKKWNCLGFFLVLSVYLLNDFRLVSMSGYVCVSVFANYSCN